LPQEIFLWFAIGMEEQHRASPGMYQRYLYFLRCLDKPEKSAKIYL